MTSLVIRYNAYILKDPKNFMNVDNCTIVQLQTKDQLTSTIGISFCNYQVAGEDPNCTIVQLKTKDFPLCCVSMILLAGESPNCTIVQLQTKDLHYI